MMRKAQETGNVTKVTRVLSIRDETCKHAVIRAIRHIHRLSMKSEESDGHKYSKEFIKKRIKL
uniref:POU-specific domain-containing protein n=1 Tax=Heterorhabditis bacteriophora TaxID=37862 RepID=A0A1I7X6Q9_HETBA